MGKISNLGICRLTRKLIGVNMKIIIILLFGLLLTNCSNQKKVIKSPNDLREFVNIFCEKPSYKSTDKGGYRVMHLLSLKIS